MPCGILQQQHFVKHTTMSDIITDTCHCALAAFSSGGFTSCSPSTKAGRLEVKLPQLEENSSNLVAWSSAMESMKSTVQYFLLGRKERLGHY